jgi:hypothetical protein
MRIRALVALAFFLSASFSLLTAARAQVQTAEPPQNAAEALPAAPQGVEVLARGPVHEAFATPTADPIPTRPVPKRPPKPLEEMPPDQKPEGDVAWISGYWAWDDDRSDYLWVSGIWRATPPGKQWVAGYWKESADQWQWVPGFWTAAAQEEAKSDVTYLPAPPAPPEIAQPAEPPTPDTFYVPGVWVWGGEHYVWRAGYWGRVQPGYVWVAAHYVWTPSGYVYIAGYWDLAVARRGVLFAPVVVNAALVGPTFVYTPAYVVSDTILVDALFVRPCYCHYYFGDYYGPAYRGIGFESCIVFGRSHYDPLFTYTCWEHRSEPSWLTVQVDVCLARHAGRAPCPPRTLVQQNVIVQQNITNVTNNVVNNNVTVNNTTVNNINKVSNTTVLAPVAKMSAVKGVPTVQINSAARAAAMQQAQAVSQVATQRSQVESASGAPPTRPRVATLNVPPTRPSAIPTSFSRGSTPATPHITAPAPRPATVPSASTVPPAHLSATHSGPAQNGVPSKLQGPLNAGPYRPNQARGGPQPPSRTPQKNAQHPPQKPGNPPPSQNHPKPTPDRPPSNGNGSSP